MGDIKMSTKERRRMEVMSRVRDKDLSQVEAAELLKLSDRQVSRIWKRYQEEGDEGLVHRSRGRSSNRALACRAEVLDRYRERYEGAGPTLASEKLWEDGWRVHPETLRRWLGETPGIAYRRRKRSRHRMRRERRARFGELIQIDGSPHAWVEGLPKPWVLMVMVDDATSRTLARFYPAETTEAAMDIFERWVRAYGVPMALYPDRDSIYVINREPTVEEQVSNRKPQTQFERAMEVLGVWIHPANSPQAKGRVERRHQLFQDRLIKELKWKGIRTMGEANAYVERVFLRQVNRRWTQAPRDAVDVHRKIPAGVNLKEVLSHEESRTVDRDYTIRFENRIFQIESRNALLPRPSGKVVVRRMRTGEIQLLYRKERLRYREISQRPLPSKPAIAPTPPRNLWRPALTHPWRNSGRFAARATEGGTPLGSARG